MIEMRAARLIAAMATQPATAFGISMVPLEPEIIWQLLHEDIPYLLAQLQDRDEKLEGVEAYLQRARPFAEFPVVSPAEVFRDHLINIDRILHKEGD